MNATTPTTIPAISPLLIVCWRTGTFCASGDGGLIAGIGGVLPGRVGVAVTGADEKVCSLARMLDELVEPVRVICMAETVAAEAVERTTRATDVEASEEVEASLLVRPSTRVTYD